MSAPLIVVSGPPGSGKSTVAALMAQRFARSAHLPGDHFFRYIRGDWKDPSRPEADEQNRLVVQISARAASGYAEAGYTTILDGIYGPWFLDILVEATRGAQLHYTILRADLATCIERTVGNSDTPASEEVVRTMHGHFDQVAQYETYVVDTSAPTPEEVTDEVIRRFEAGEFLLS